MKVVNEMKSILSFTVASLVVLALVCSPSLASVQVGDQFQFGNGVGTPGGIFHADNLSNGVGPDFDTFCVEITAGIAFGPTYTVSGIGDTTVNGNKTISSYTAWLYTSFLESTLSSFDATMVNDVNALQLEIWKSIGYTAAEISSEIGSSWYNTYNAVLAGKAWDTEFAASGFSGLGGVQVMNLLTATGGDAQDQLVRIIPEPLSIVVWSLIAVCVGTVRRGRE
jgi:hypothetical protein